MPFHWKEGWSPPHIQTPESDRRVTPSRQGSSVRTPTQGAPRGATLEAHTGGDGVWAAYVGPCDSEFVTFVCGVKNTQPND